jgi:integrase
MCALYFGTGLRPSELRLAHYKDIDTKNWTLWVRNPKGKGSWASEEGVEVIRDDMKPIILRYEHERKLHLKDMGLVSHIALFPSLDGQSKTGFYSANNFSDIKSLVEKLSGVQFRLKDFRSTLASITVNDDLALLPAISVQLRHQSEATTRRHYAAIQRANAAKQLRGAGKERPVYVPRQSPDTVSKIDTGTPLLKFDFDLLDEASGGSARI